MSSLLVLSASNPDDETIKWMIGVLDVAPLPEQRIIRAAKDKNGLWDRRLRKDAKTRQIKAEPKDWEDHCEAVEHLARRRGGFLL